MKQMEIRRITARTKNYIPKVENAYGIMKKRIKHDELEPMENIVRGIERARNYFFMVAESNGKISGVCTGAALACGAFSIIFGHYTVVEKDSCGKGIGTVLRNDREAAARDYLDARGLPELKYHFMELSKPETGDDVGKLWALRKKRFGIVMTPDGKNIFRYIVPDLYGGTEHTPMMTAVSSIENRTAGSMPKNDYIEILEAVYESYKRQYPANSDYIDWTKRALTMRLVNIRGDMLPLVSEPAIILDRELEVA